MARKSTKSTKVTEEVPAQVPETQTAGNPQDEAEAVNLKTATDTTDTEVIAATEIKAKKERKQKADKEVKEAKNVESDDEKPKPKAKKEPKAKKVESDADEPKAKTPKEPKEKKRAPSAYNLFVKEVMPSLKKENEALDEGKKKTQRDLMKLAAELWNKKKAEA